MKNQNEIVNTKTFAKLNEAVGAVGLHGMDTLYAFMIKNQLQNVQQMFRSSQDRIVVGSISLDAKHIEHTILKSQKPMQQLSEIIVIIGTLQILRRHIAYQLNTTCKFDSAHLEASLRTMNEYVNKFVD